METLHVDLGNRGYPIFIGENLLEKPECLIPFITGNQVLVVSNTTVAPLYLEKVIKNLTDAGKQVITHILPDGEQFKTLEQVEGIFTSLLKGRFNRDCSIAALGGGVVGDMSGFAAACYQRGVDFVQIPTTLLSQVDSSVGGKTGVNHALGKNMIGAFKQPKVVLADVGVLDTLNAREFSAGLAEIIKYGLIRDNHFIVWLETNIEKMMMRDKAVVAEAVSRSCRNKAEVVAADEFETDQRALLNLGHTFGHAIETSEGYGSWLHGEAVATGMLMAADLSWRSGWISQEDVLRVRRLLLRAGLPVVPPVHMTPAQFLELMAVDKKVQAGKLRLVLLKALGDAVITADFSWELLQQTLAAGSSLGQVSP
ncbi:3-dehydroquinate synthase [Fluviicoccus keumensis]|uniref:3-dehydroquinate synthase n=1 Tax=Fluviicoccus keumensis TaxID=1435465 RepID=A0A4Q7ZBY4_9GAMM|nr:3-dehydroquinate synthase [Fluviicoccus keumensis]RZU47465.1 3-dehydroquinate synthase [Fluviicoccus keumensis]